MRDPWADLLRVDPAYGSNLSLGGYNFVSADLPGTTTPWLP